MLRRALLPILLLALAAPLVAQPVFDAQSSVADVYTPPADITTTLAHTTTAAANRILIVSLHMNRNVAPTTVATSVTYGGQPLTFLAARNDASNIIRVELWYLLAPPSGTNNVVLTVGGLGAGEHADAVVGATTFSNVDQVAPATASNSGTGDPATVAIAAATNDFIVDFIGARENVNLTPDFQTQGFNISTGNNPSDLRGSSSGRAAATPTTTMSWNVSSSRPWSLIAVRLRSVTADLAVTKATNSPGADGAFAQGEALTYTITVTNNGPLQATNVVVTDPLPSGYTFSSVSPGASCSHSSGTVTCNYATLNVGATNIITINGTIAVSQTQLINTASATATQPDSNSANNSATATANILAPTVAELLQTSAVQDAKGKVVVSWTTSFEADNLGFNLYRQTSSGRVKVNKELIAGSALFSAKQALTSGRGYRWKDRVQGGQFAQYFLEDIDLNGTRTTHGPITPALVSEVGETANTDTLAELGSTGGIFVSARGIGASPSIATPAPRVNELAAQPAIKLLVTQEGWYRVTFAQLTTAGFAPGKKLALFTGGIEQPIVVTADAVEFYGLGLDTPSAGARAYWLTNDRGMASRIAKDKSKGTRPAITSTPFTYERIERTVFFTALTNNGDRENFFGAIVTSGGATQQLFVENADRTASSASLELTLQGGSEAAHQVRLTLGEHDLGVIHFDGLSRHVERLNVPLSALADGTNTLTLTSLGGDLDVTVVESLRLTYPHRLVADDNALKIALPGGTSATIAGFTSMRVRAIDVTNPAQPIELEAAFANGKATLTAPGQGTRTILVLGDSRVLAPAQLAVSRPSTWSSTRNAADLVIVTTRALAPAAEPLKVRRQREGLTTVIVDVQDLYDEFTFGHRGPEAVRAFLAQTRNWSGVPKYVLFLGDASVDPRNYLGLGTFDSIPTKLVPTYYMKTASDDWFVEGLGMAIGRLPARTLAEAQTMVQRIADRNTDGNDRVSFVVDPSFNDAATSLSGLVPASHPRTIASSANGAFDSLLLTYIGHGSVDLWNTSGLTGAAAAQLANGTKQPIVAAMTCLNGYFHDVYMTSLAEALLTNPNGGAAAVWASSTLTEPGPQLDMARAFFTHLFNGATIGDAAMRAKSATTDQDVRRSWILFGDPSMKLR
jgi:uncharacterized repeat protein (TIGR01451 family)